MTSRPTREDVEQWEVEDRAEVAARIAMFEIERAEWTVENVLRWFEFGHVGSITVSQAQGEPPQVSWTAPTRLSLEAGGRHDFETRERYAAEGPSDERWLR